MPKTAVVCALLLASACCAPQESAAGQQTQTAGSVSDSLDLLSFEELVKLSETAKSEGELGRRLDAVLSSAPIHNDGAVPPRKPKTENLGSLVRVGVWNIERGLNLEDIKGALTGNAKLPVDGSAGGKEGQKELVGLQLSALRDVDVLVLTEADLGMKRTGYKDVARELAGALQMNYVYGVEFVEVDPIFELGTEEVHVPADAQADARLSEDLKVDRRQYRGLHGTAILSRYPIGSARVVRLPVCYDWYREERKAISKLESGRRWSADKLFRERIERELRHGGRMALIADVAIPELPTGAATVVAAHLENKCDPSCRRLQVKALLSEVKNDTHPVILAGDFNTTSRDNTPTSFRNEITKRVADYKFWIGQVASHFNPLGIFKYALVPVRYLHGYNDPTAFHVPIFWDNGERGLFKAVERFRFADGRAFDFRGRPERTLRSRKRTLADSNERGGKGFVPTYRFRRDYGGLVGGFKLDWIFVSPFIRDPRKAGQSYRFAPHFPMTMRELNESVPEGISDHPPLTVDLPLEEPASLPR